MTEGIGRDSIDEIVYLNVRNKLFFIIREIVKKKEEYLDEVEDEFS